MKTLIEQGPYTVIQYSESFVCLDYSNRSVGMTLKTFEAAETAQKVFHAVIEKTGGNTQITDQELNEICLAVGA